MKRMKTAILSARFGLVAASLGVLCPQPLQAATIVVGLFDCGIVPPNVSINLGDTVVWRREFPADPSSYFVESYTGEWKSPAITTNSFSFTVTSPGTFYYRSSAAPGTVTVVASTNPPPDLSIAAPPDGFRFVGGDLLMQAATAKNPVEVASIIFFEGANVLGIATNAPYRLTTSWSARGEFSLTAQMTDTAGITWTSPPVKIKVVDNWPNYVCCPRPLPGGRFAFNWSSVAPRHHIESSVDLTNWTCGSRILCTGYGTYVDETCTNGVKTFYRVNRGF